MSHRPKPVEGDDFSVPCAGALAARLMTSDGREMPIPSVSLDDMVAAAPFRSIIAKHWLTEIAYIWPLLKPDPLPLPDAALEAIADVIHTGHSVFLLSFDRERRNQVRATLLALFGLGASA